ncbi:MAG TPA: sensor histidine kinase [Ktedonobacteraceae bacterium]|nr:sensor histidine kinase [Ktedonobacteraceae bacterium]
MSSQPTIEEREVCYLSLEGASVLSLTLLIGYLFTLLTATRLTLLNFLLFTALQLGYGALLWWMRRVVGKSPKQWPLPLALGLLVVLTGAVGLLPATGLQWDWLLFLVTLSLFFTFLSLRLAISAGLLLFVAVVFNLGWLSDWQWSQIYGSLLSLFPAFLFVGLFSLFVRILEIQKARAERLFRQLEASNAELERAHVQLQNYASEVEELTIVHERTRLAREIHDTLGHYLSILTIQLETIGKWQERDPARAAVEIAEARRVASQAMQEVRNAVAALRPTGIAELSFAEAMTQLGKEFERNAPETSLTLDLETEFPALSPDISVALYRAVQETLTNIRKHARASKVLARLRYEDGALELLVLDNGKGLADTTPARPGKGFGLVGLRERIELLGGQVSYGPAQQGGYRVTVRVPVPAEPSASFEGQQGRGEAEQEARIIF